MQTVEVHVIAKQFLLRSLLLPLVSGPSLGWAQDFADLSQYAELSATDIEEENIPAAQEGAPPQDDFQTESINEFGDVEFSERQDQAEVLSSNAAEGEETEEAGLLGSLLEGDVSRVDESIVEISDINNLRLDQSIGTADFVRVAGGLLDETLSHGSNIVQDGPQNFLHLR
jgi:hypothetical protein